MKKNIKFTEEELIDGSNLKYVGQMVTAALEALVGVCALAIQVSFKVKTGEATLFGTIGGITFTCDGIRRFIMLRERRKEYLEQKERAMKKKARMEKKDSEEKSK